MQQTRSSRKDSHIISLHQGRPNDMLIDEGTTENGPLISNINDLTFRYCSRLLLHYWVSLFY